MNKAVFLDRDGTLNIDYGYVHDMAHFHLFPDVIDTLVELKKRGYLLIIVTNQSGIERGYYSEQEYEIFEKQILSFFLSHNVEISRIYHCPHWQSECECRKPRTGLFYKAAMDFNIDFAQSFAIGDKVRDLSICEEEPVRGILLSSRSNLNYTVVKNLSEILNIIK